MALILMGVCASSNLGKGLNVAVVGSAVADHLSTRAAINSGLAKEGNPVMGQGALRQGLLKVIGVSGVIALARLIDLKQRPILAHVVRGVAIAIWSGAAIHNWRVSR